MANATGGDVDSQTYVYPLSSFYEYYTAYLEQPDAASQVAMSGELTSRLLPRSICESDPAAAAKAILAVEGGINTNTVAGGYVSQVDPDSMALNPSWRPAVAHIDSGVSWPEGASNDDIQSLLEVIKKNTDILDTMTTDSGSYFNEGSLHEKDFQKAYWGPHYPTLSLIKKNYDPQSLFVVASGVGSEEWDSALECRL